MYLVTNVPYSLLADNTLPQLVQQRQVGSLCSPGNGIGTVVVNPAKQKKQVFWFHIQPHFFKEKSQLGTAEETLVLHVVFVEYRLFG